MARKLEIMENEKNPLDDLIRGVLVSSYCCSTYKVADPFSNLGTFSSSFIGGPVCLANTEVDAHSHLLDGTQGSQ